MLRSHARFSALFLPALILLPLLSAASNAFASPAASTRVALIFKTDEAEAVLSILSKKRSGQEVTASDWQRLFATEPYMRLKQREASMKRDFTDEDFQKFVLSPELAAKEDSLRQTLDAWKKADLEASARRALLYLPDQAHIHAKVFPMIKPLTNSFVFDTAEDPAIFLYLDPQETAAKFENTVAHELHHIGFSSIQTLSDAKLQGLPPNAKAAVDWMGAFGEGFAMLAAAGSPEIHPHSVSPPEERARWDHDMANFNQDALVLQQFFLDVVNQKLKTKDEVNEKAASFFGTQGPWYTVGYQMAVIVEHRYGRAVLVDCMLDPRELLVRYNAAAVELNRERKVPLQLWSPELLAKVGAKE